MSSIDRAAALDAGRRRRAELDDATLLLRSGLASPSGGRQWAAVLRAGVRQVQADLREHIALTEGPDGLYEEIEHEEPRLEPAVHRLRREHQQLSTMLDALGEALRNEPDVRGAGPLRDRADELLTLLERHRRQDTQLAYDAIAVDLGGQE